METIAKDLLAGNRRALARAISMVENGGPEALWLVRKLFPLGGKAHIIGVTGSPGVGKSTLVGALIGQARQAGLKVGVLAVDPSSPFTGGAILGDRIRMQDHTLDQDVFIRSMANRGHVGATAFATFDVARMLDACGYHVVIIETVGAGQSELAIAQAADTTILALMPGSGDEIQAIKSGIMEIGDIFVVNKGDLPGANKTAAEIKGSLELAGQSNLWKPPVL
ncbi:MAG: methylmalonyl Co-A mutase-associated GTPase MeaB, partial [Candidatus Melainabacteria bacterium]|nr:methylmalonyl Co-A mutase-associated GTPase MeaB [Candidatus Melainabacteria bacterium]